MKTRTVKGGRAGWQDIPLPGMHPCLTWQLNVTAHRATGLSKWVSVLREPTDQIEIVRAFQDLEPWADTWQPLMSHMTDSINALEYLHSWGPGVHWAPDTP